MTEKMTKRDKFLEVIEKLEQVSGTRDLIDFIQEQIELIDRKAQKAKDNAKKRKTQDELLPVVKECLTDEFKTIADIVNEIEMEDVTAAKVSSRLNKLVASGDAVKETVVIEKRKLVAYKLV